MFYTEIKRQAKNGKDTFSGGKYELGLCIALTMLVKKQIKIINYANIERVKSLNCANCIVFMLLTVVEDYIFIPLQFPQLSHFSKSQLLIFGYSWVSHL